MLIRENKLSVKIQKTLAAHTWELLVQGGSRVVSNEGGRSAYEGLEMPTWLNFPPGLEPPLRVTHAILKGGAGIQDILTTPLLDSPLLCDGDKDSLRPRKLWLCSAG